MTREILPANVPPATLHYAAPQAASRRYTLEAWLSLVAAVLPGVFLMLLVGGARLMPVVLILPTLFGGMIACAAVTIWLMVLMVRRGTGIVALELIAALGFLFPIFTIAIQDITPMVVGLGCLAMGSMRHFAVYRTLSRWCRAAGWPRTADNAAVVGVVRAVYELCWCGIIVAWVMFSLMHVDIGLGPVAYYGLYGYGALWIWLLVSHLCLVQALGRGRER